MNLAGYIFHGPFTHLKGFNSIIPAVYTIIDTRKVVDVGQTEDLNNRFPNHPRQPQWEACREGNLALYILPEADGQKSLRSNRF